MDIYWYLNNLSYEERISKLEDTPYQDLIGMILNKSYNDFLSEYADYEEDEEPVNSSIPNGKEFGRRLPYHGWHWRSVDFYNKVIPVGVGDSFKGFMENNKWGYPEGKLDEEQFNQVIAIIDQAMRFSEKGGEFSEIRRNTVQELEKLWPLFQEFKVTVTY